MAHGMELAGGAGVAPGRRRHRRLDVRALGHHRPVEHRVQRRRRHRHHPRQPHHRDDGPPGQPGQRAHARRATQSGRDRHRGARPRAGRDAACGRSTRTTSQATEAALREEVAARGAVGHRDEGAVRAARARPGRALRGRRGSVHGVRRVHQARVSGDRQAADGKADIDVALCVGCAQCVQVCTFDAIVHTGPSCDLGGV